MLDQANRVLGKMTTLIQIGAALLIGAIMVFSVGLPLVSHGVASGFVPLIIGICAFITAAVRTRDLLRF